MIGRNRVGTGRRSIARALVIALSALGLGFVVVAQAPVTHAVAHDIGIVDFAFQPAELTVFTGEPVTWTNNGAVAHTVTFDDGTADSGQILPNESYGHVFDTPGTFKYHCANHPSAMTATIVVKAAPVTPVPSGSPVPTPPAGTLPPNFSPFPSTGPMPTPSPVPSPTPTPAPTAAPSGATTGGDGGGIGGILATMVLVVLVGGVATYLVRALARPKGGAKAGTKASAKGGPRTGPDGRTPR